jgi:glycosyltransferase involved in cell wall biosynthesis
MRELAAENPEVALCVDTIQLRERARQGWEVPDLGNIKLRLVSDWRDATQVLDQCPKQAIHVVGGWRDSPVRRCVIARVHALGGRVGAAVEDANPLGWKGLARKLLYRMACLRYRSELDFLLAIGQSGVEWYTRRGFPGEKVLPFWYTVENECAQATPNDRDSDGIARLIYVGRLDHNKGADILLDALAKLDCLEWRLTIIGKGPRLPALMKRAQEMKVGQVTFEGPQPNRTVRNALRNHDLAVVPSRYDGWGAVVNEALMCGTPVICSSACGARVLVEGSSRGSVFDAGSPESLSREIQAWACGRVAGFGSRSAVQEWSRRINGSAAAAYLRAALEHVYGSAPRPAPPWADGG